MIPTITAQQRAQFDHDGYFLIDDVFTPGEMDTLAALIEEHQRRHSEALVLNGSSEGDISRAGEITFTSYLAEQDPEIRTFILRPEFVAITTQLVGPDVDLYWNQSVFKAPEGTREFPWHQDDAYAPVDPAPYLTLWLALNDATLANGCISVLPGSHKQGLIPHTPSSIGLTCHSSDDPDQGVLVPVKAGSLAVFWSQTFHKSGANTSNGFRKAYVIQYAKSPLRKVETGELVEELIPLARGGVGV